MPKEMQGRRLIIPKDIDPYLLLEKAGDYCGPIVGWTANNPAIYFLLPVAQDLNVHRKARIMHYVISPPHIFIEESDGTLTIRESIGNPYWHGYLTKGRWQLNRD